MRKPKPSVPPVRLRSSEGAGDPGRWSRVDRARLAAVAAVLVGSTMALGALWMGAPFRELAPVHGVLGGVGAAVFVFYFAEAVWRRF